MNDIDKILSNTDNRSDPLPDRPWKYFQQWNDTLFLHWICPVDAIRQYVPASLEIDTFNGSAWISLVVFSVKKLRVRGLPSFGYLSEFEEINLRTYVVKDGVKGIYMFSIETDKFLTILITRLFIGLPYIKSEIKRKNDTVTAANSNKSYALKIKYKPGSKINKIPLVYWLTERHSLYEAINDTMYRFDIHHAEWVLKNPIVTIKKLNYSVGKIDLNGLHPTLKHYSPNIKVLLWGRVKG